MKYKTAEPLSHDDIKSYLNECNRDGIVVGLCHGCFDILHIGHLRHFEFAKSLCDILIVSVTKDEFINKGPNRPVFEERMRATLVAGLKPVNATFISSHETASASISLVKPDNFYKGQDYSDPSNVSNPNFFKEKELVESLGGKIVFTEGETNSSSQTFQKIQRS